MRSTSGNQAPTKAVYATPRNHLVQSLCSIKKYLATYTLFALHATPAYEYTSITLLLVTIFTSLTVITGWQTDHYPLALNAMTW